MNPIIYADMHEHRLGLSFIAAQYDDTGIEAMLDQSNTIDFISPDELDALADYARHELADWLEECARQYRNATQPTDNTDTEDTTMHRNPTHPYTGTPQPNRTTMG